MKIALSNGSSVDCSVPNIRPALARQISNEVVALLLMTPAGYTRDQVEELEARVAATHNAPTAAAMIAAQSNPAVVEGVVLWHHDIVNSVLGRWTRIGSRNFRLFWSWEAGRIRHKREWGPIKGPAKITQSKAQMVLVTKYRELADHTSEVQSCSDLVAAGYFLAPSTVARKARSTHLAPVRP
jgi:hypothetical protein